MSQPTFNPLKFLEGAQLSSVEFVQDYVQFRFDGPCLTAITHPRVCLMGQTYEWGMSEYRNALCERIGKSVLRTLNERDEIKIEFEDDSSISISLNPSDYRTAEAATFHNPPNPICVW